MTTKLISGKIYIVGDDIDTDQIIPAIHLVYSMKNAEERLNYGKYALSGLPKEKYPIPFIKEGHESEFSIIIAGDNFGCGSSREQAPAALQIAGIKAVIAKSYARIFYRNVIDGAFFYPFEFKSKDIFPLKNGDNITIDIDQHSILQSKTNSNFLLGSLGDARHILESGGIFSYARKQGISTLTTK